MITGSHWYRKLWRGLSKPREGTRRMRSLQRKLKMQLPGAAFLDFKGITTARTDGTSRSHHPHHIQVRHRPDPPGTCASRLLQLYRGDREHSARTTWRQLERVFECRGRADRLENCRHSAKNCSNYGSISTKPPKRSLPVSSKFSRHKRDQRTQHTPSGYRAGRGSIDQMLHLRRATLVPPKPQRCQFY